MNKNWIKEIKLKIQERRDKRFLHQLERVIQNNYIKASPIIDGYIMVSRDMLCTSSDHFDKPIDRIRYDMEHPNPKTINIEATEDLSHQLKP